MDDASEGSEDAGDVLPAGLQQLDVHVAQRKPHAPRLHAAQQRRQDGYHPPGRPVDIV